MKGFFEKFALWLSPTLAAKFRIYEREVAELKSDLMVAENQSIYYAAQFDELKDKFNKLKEEADKVSNRNAQLEEQHRDIMMDQFVIQVKALNPKDDKILALVVRHNALLDHTNFARINHTLRHACPWLDLVFMIHENVELKTMTDAELDAIGLRRVPKKEYGVEDGSDKANSG